MRRLFWGLTISYWVILFALTHLPAARLPQPRLSDKLMHIGAYAVLASTLYISMWLSRSSGWRCAWVTIAVGLAYGALDELLQIPVGRDCELADWIADSAGVVAAAAMLSLIRYLMYRRCQQAVL